MLFFLNVNDPFVPNLLISLLHFRKKMPRKVSYGLDYSDEYDAYDDYEDYSYDHEEGR